LIFALAFVMPIRIQRNILDFEDIANSDWVAWVLSYSAEKSVVQIRLTKILDLEMVEIQSTETNESFDLLYIQTLDNMEEIIAIPDVFVSMSILLQANESRMVSIGLGNVVNKTHYYSNLMKMNVTGQNTNIRLLNTSEIAEDFWPIHDSRVRLQINLDREIEEIIVGISLYYYVWSSVGWIICNNYCYLGIIAGMISIFYKINRFRLPFIFSLSVTITSLLLYFFNYPVKQMFETFPGIDLTYRSTFDIGVFLTIFLLLIKRDKDITR